MTAECILRTAHETKVENSAIISDYPSSSSSSSHSLVFPGFGKVAWGILRLEKPIGGGIATTGPINIVSSNSCWASNCLQLRFIFQKSLTSPPVCFTFIFLSLVASLVNGTGTEAWGWYHLPPHFHPKVRSPNFQLSTCQSKRGSLLASIAHKGNFSEEAIVK